MRTLVLAVLLCCPVVVLSDNGAEQRLSGEIKLDSAAATYVPAGQLYSKDAAGKFSFAIAGRWIAVQVSALDDKGDFTISDEQGVNIGKGECIFSSEEQLQLRVDPEAFLINIEGLRICNLDFSVDGWKVTMRKAFEADELLLISGRTWQGSYRDMIEWDMLTASGRRSVTYLEVCEGFGYDY